MTPVQLPANKGYAFRRAYFDRVQEHPAWAGVLRIEESRYADFSSPVVSRYLAVEHACPDGGRLFQVVKPGGTERYWVRLKPGDTSCDCVAGLQYECCKHALALTALAGRGLLGPNPNEPARVANTNQT